MSWWSEERVGNKRYIILSSFNVRVFFILLAFGILVLGVMLLLSAFSEARTSNIPSMAGLPSDPLVLAAMETYSNWIRGAEENTQEEDGTFNIPSKHWAEDIKALKPVKVYTHRVNMVVVQWIKDNVEEGKYICIPISSYLPHSGPDGFEFTPNPLQGNLYQLREVLDFKRNRK
jgi:hypothetical protein